MLLPGGRDDGTGARLKAVGVVGEGRSRLAQFGWLGLMLCALLLLCLGMSLIGLLVPADPDGWTMATWEILGGLVASGGLVWLLLKALSQQIVMLRHWGKPLVVLDDDGIRIASVMAGTLPWTDIAGVGTGGATKVSDSGGARQGVESHVVICLRRGGGYRNHGIPFLSATRIDLPSVDPASLAAEIAAHPGYRGTPVKLGHE